MEFSDLNQGQRDACDLFNRWWKYERFERDFHVQGLAGTGKTSLLQFLTQDHNIRIHYCAPTGKAARVVSHRIGKPATTIHAFMYRPVTEEIDKLREEITEIRHTIQENISAAMNQGKPKPVPEDYPTLFSRIEELREQIKFIRSNKDSDARFTFTEPDPDIADAVVVDEGSMVTMKMGEDFARVQIPKIIVCDPAQLPPVKSLWAYQNVKPDVFLTEIMRTGPGSGVARAAGDVRFGRKLQAYGEDFVIAKRGEIGISKYLSYGMVLAGTNDLRKRVNKAMRAERGYKYPLEEGEKLMALNNQSSGLCNGEVITVERIITDDHYKYYIDAVDQYGNFFPMVDVYKRALEFDEGQHDISRNMGQFCYGQCITVHKSQGSEEERVLLLNSWGQDRPDYSRWLYTGVSRASKHCTFVA